jgi:hypothetical protein
MDDATLRDRLTDLADHLTATAERPVETRASRYLGEAEAVARDLADSDADREVVATRIGHVRDLLDPVEETDDPAADDHVAAASRLADEIHAALSESE